MSKEALAKVVQRAISDAGFRRQLNSDPAGALRGFDLSADELSALRTGNAGRLSSLGVDQRMSKAFAIGGAAAATRMSQSDLTAGAPTAFDDGTAGVGRTIIPHDPEAASTADLDGAAASKSRINDDSDGFLAANARASGGTGSVRTGDDWKFTDRAATQGSVAPIEGSPEATAAELGRSGGMANYPAHDGLAGPSAAGSARAGDDWARAASAQADDSARIGAARLDDASGSSSGASVVNDDPDGFLAANANADLSGGTTAASSIKDDPDGFLAANKDADFSSTATGEGTGFLDDSEGYLTKVGYDPNAATSAVTDAHDRGGENIVTRIADDDADSTGTSATSENGPNISS